MSKFWAVTSPQIDLEFDRHHAQICVVIQRTGATLRQWLAWMDFTFATAFLPTVGSLPCLCALVHLAPLSCLAKRPPRFHSRLVSWLQMSSSCTAGSRLGWPSCCSVDGFCSKRQPSRCPLLVCGSGVLVCSSTSQTRVPFLALSGSFQPICGWCEACWAAWACRCCRSSPATWSVVSSRSYLLPTPEGH